jgi:hypothetical protein
MLDLSLDHLGLITQPDEVDAAIEDKYAIQNGLQDVVDQIGQGKSTLRAFIYRGLIDQSFKSFRLRLV